MVSQQQGPALGLKGRRRGRLLEPGQGGSRRGLPAKGRMLQQENRPWAAAGRGGGNKQATVQLWCAASASQQLLEAREAAAILQMSPQDTEQGALEGKRTTPGVPESRRVTQMKTLEPS